MDTLPLRVGLIGANWGVMTHLPAWRSLCDIEVVAICTSREDSARKAAVDHGIEKPYWDFRAMCADPTIDIIDAGTRPKLREEMIAVAISEGKHVVNQIPFATSGAAADVMAQAARNAGVVGVAAASVLGLPQLRLMKDMIDGGYLGEIFQVHCHWQMSYFNPPMPGFPWPWFADPEEGASVTRNQGSHMLHALIELFGLVRSVVGQAVTFIPQWELAPGVLTDVRSDDVMSALLQFESGALGSMATSWVAADSPGFSIEAFGKDGRLRLESDGYPSPSAARLLAAKPNHAFEPTASVVTVPASYFIVDGATSLSLEGGSQALSMARIFRSLVDAIRGRSAPLASFERAAYVQRVIEAIYRSITERRWIDPEPPQGSRSTGE